MTRQSVIKLISIYYIADLKHLIFKSRRTKACTLEQIKGMCLQYAAQVVPGSSVLCSHREGETAKLHPECYTYLLRPLNTAHFTCTPLMLRASVSLFFLYSHFYVFILLSPPSKWKPRNMSYSNSHTIYTHMDIHVYIYTVQTHSTAMRPKRMY